MKVLKEMGMDNDDSDAETEMDPRRINEQDAHLQKQCLMKL